MSDYFQLLGQPRAPWLDAAAVERAFIAISATTHPDHFHQAREEDRRAAHERSAAINRAHQCLRDPRLRLRHFLELERGTRIIDLQDIPDDLMEIFMEVGRLLSSVDHLLNRVTRMTSPLLKVAEFGRSQDLQERIEAWRQKLQQHRTKLETQLKGAQEQWVSLDVRDATARETLLADLETVYRLLSFYDRWTDQLQQRGMKLLALV